MWAAVGSQANLPGVVQLQRYWQKRQGRISKPPWFPQERYQCLARPYYDFSAASPSGLGAAACAAAAVAVAVAAVEVEAAAAAGQQQQQQQQHVSPLRI
eukprot:COSAG05_NODE_9776_length_602_cov_0.614314_1_plen_99_part_00